MAVPRQRIHLPPKSWPRALVSPFRGDLGHGDQVVRLERDFAEFTGVPDAVAVPSGRAGLRFIFDTLGLEPGSEVICSAFGYPVVPHLAKSLGFHLRLADCETETLGMDPDALARTISSETRVVIATHLYGVPCRIEEIAEITHKHGAVLIEDCAHCYGASVAGRRTGSFGRFGYFSFETSKPINTLGGGIVTTSDPEDARRIREVARVEPGKDMKWLAKRLFKTSFEATVTNPLIFNLAVYPALRVLQGRDEKKDRFASGYQRDEVTMTGRLGRFTNYQARLGLDQMRDAMPRVERRIANARRMIDQLRGRVQFQSNDRDDVVSNYMLVTALVPNMPDVARRLLQVGVDTKHRYMRDCTGLLDGGERFPGAERAEREVLHLPAHPELSASQIDWVSERVARVIETTGSVEKPAAMAG